MRRREFIKLVSGAAVWPAVVRAQQHRSRRVAVLMGFSESDVPWQDRLTAFRAALAQLGWTPGRNLQIDVRWAVGDRERQRAYAAELIRLGPDVIFASPASAARIMHQQTRAIPIVAVQSGDLARVGLVQSHARPGGNVTGFMLFVTTINTKYLQLIKGGRAQLEPGRGDANAEFGMARRFSHYREDCCVTQSEASANSGSRHRRYYARDLGICG